MKIRYVIIMARLKGIITCGLIVDKVVLLSKSSPSALVRGNRVDYLGLSLNRFQILTRVSVDSFNKEERHITNLWTRRVLHAG